MAINNPSGLTINYQQTGIQYTKVTNSSSDWSGITNSTYFYDLTDKLVHYKDSTGTVLEIFSATGSGSSSTFTGGTVSGPTNFTNNVSGNTFTLSDVAIPTGITTGSIALGSYNQQGFSVPHYYDTQGNSIEMSRDNIFVARNNSGGAMTKGQVVYVSGSTGTVPTIALAKADSISTLNIIGVCYENISNNAFGRIMTLGNLEKYDLSLYAAGDILYVSPITDGLLTATKPSYPNYAQPVGIVLNNGIGNGVLAVINRGIDSVKTGDSPIFNSITATTLNGATQSQSIDSIIIATKLFMFNYNL